MKRISFARYWAVAFGFLLVAASQAKLFAEKGSVAFQAEGDWLRPDLVELVFQSEADGSLASVSPLGQGKVKELALEEGMHRLLAIKQGSESFYCPPDECVYEVQAGRTLYIGSLFFVRKGLPGLSESLRFEIVDRSREVEKLFTRPDMPEVFCSDVKTMSIRSSGKSKTKPKKLAVSTSPSRLEGLGAVALSFSLPDRGPAALSDVLSALALQLDISSMFLEVSRNGELPFRLSMDAKFAGRGGRLKLEDYCKTKHVYVALPPGNYVVQNMVCVFTDNQMLGFNLPIRMEFEVSEGQVSYLGDVFALPNKEKVLGMDFKAYAEFYISNKWERDSRYLKEKASALGRWPVQIQVLHPSSVFEDIVHRGDFSDRLDREQSRS